MDTVEEFEYLGSLITWDMGSYCMPVKPGPSKNRCNHNTSSASYENNIAQNFNSLSEELNYDNDSNQNPLPIPSSKYITQFQLKDVVKNFSKDTFSLLHINIRSISKHFDDLQILLDNQSKHSFLVIGLTETWLSSDTTYLMQ